MQPQPVQQGLQPLTVTILLCLYVFTIIAELFSAFLHTNSAVM